MIPNQQQTPGREGLAARVVLIAACLAFALACGATAPARYLVTTSPLDVGLGSQRLCIAVDPDDRTGVWWWDPGQSGCSSRSTGPGVVHAEQAGVMAAGSVVQVTFRVPVQRPAGSTLPGFADIAIAIEDGIMRALAVGQRVPVERRPDLEIPEQPAAR
jgi:hypothetical protein